MATETPPVIAGTSREIEISRRYQLCSATTKAGKPCRQAALRGETLCKHHSEAHRRAKAAGVLDRLTLIPMDALLSLDVSLAPQLKRFRHGVMCHVAKGSLGATEAKSLLDTALSIYESDHKTDGRTAFNALAGRIADRLKKRE